MYASTYLKIFDVRENEDYTVDNLYRSQTYMGTSGLEHRPTDETRLIIKELYAAGVTVTRLAARLDIHEDTLRKHYRAELDDSLENMNSALAKGLYADALAGDKQAREFWLKTRARWSYAKAPEDAAKDEKMQTLMEKVIDKL